MRIRVKIYGAEELVEQAGNDGEAMVEFPGGITADLFGSILTQPGFTWTDFPLLKDWEEKLSIFIMHNDNILPKADYGRGPLADGDRLRFHIHMGCC